MLAAAASLVMTMTACGVGGTVPDPDSASPTAPAPDPDPTTDAGSELTLADIEAHVADAEWSFAPGGLELSYPVALSGGTATDDLGRSYDLGAGVGGDVNGDGIVDAAIPITEHDGNGMHQLWYIWLGTADGGAVQVEYPVARTSRCGDFTQSVGAIDGAFEIDVALRMPVTDDAVPCSDPGTGILTRWVRVIDVGGAAYPMQIAPVEAWGGVCPPSPWLDGIEETGIAGRVAPPTDAPVVTDPARSIGLFALPDAPLLTSDGARFFGFIQDYDEADAVRMHCAFAE